MALSTTQTTDVIDNVTGVSNVSNVTNVTSLLTPTSTSKLNPAYIVIGSLGLGGNLFVALVSLGSPRMRCKVGSWWMTVGLQA